MPYVSCQYAPPDPLQAEPKPAGQKAITCIDDQGQVWWLTEDSQVGDWLRFKETGGTVLEAPPPPEPDPEPDPTTRVFPVGPIPIARIEPNLDVPGIVVLLEAGPLLRLLFEDDRLRLEATGDPELNRTVTVRDIDRRSDGLAAFFIPGIDLDRVIEGRGRITILSGS